MCESYPGFIKGQARGLKKEEMLRLVLQELPSLKGNGHLICCGLTGINSILIGTYAAQIILAFAGVYGGGNSLY